MRICKLLLFLLLLCVPAFGAQTYYVDPDVVGGDADGSSWANAYATLNAGLAARAGNITSIAGGVIFDCRASLGSNDTTQATVDGYTTDADSPITLKSTDGTYKLVVSNGSSLIIKDQHVIVELPYIEMAASNANAQACINISTLAAGNLIQIRNCTMKGCNTTSYYNSGIKVNDSDAIVYISNCLVYNIGYYNNVGNSGYYIAAATTANIYNCTVAGTMKYGYNASSGTVVCKNCVGLGTTTADFYDGGSTSTQINCCSEDATGDDFDTHAVGNIVSQTLSAFTATYRLQAGNPCIDAGADLSGDTPAVTTDIDGQARSGTYDIGCDELVTSYPLLMRRRHL